MRKPRTLRAARAATGALTVVATVMTAAVMTPTIAPALPALSCSEYIVVGVPGSYEGRSHNPTSTRSEDVYGPEVWQAVKEVNTRLAEHGIGPATSSAVEYPANLDKDPVSLILNYGGTEYKKSKDAGYSATYAAVASTCESSKVILIGYSQGAHIAGDIAQTIFHSARPIGKERLAGVLLLADPAFNNDSPGTWTFDYVGSTPPFVSVTDYNRAEDAKGSLGSRAAFSTGDPVVSICLNGDAVCAATVENADAQSATVVHTAYKSAELSNTGKSTATWSADLLIDTIFAG